MKLIFLFIFFIAPVMLHAQIPRSIHGLTKKVEAYTSCFNIRPAIYHGANLILDSINTPTQLIKVPAPDNIFNKLYRLIDTTKTAEDTLVVVDNYIYEGKMTNLNHSEITSLTILNNDVPGIFLCTSRISIIVVVETINKKSTKRKRKL